MNNNNTIRAGRSPSRDLIIFLKPFRLFIIIAHYDHLHSARNMCVVIIIDVVVRGGPITVFIISALSLSSPES